MAEQIIAANSGAKQQIVVVQGEAFIKDARGQLQAIKAGDVLLEGQVIVTDAQGHLTILLPNGQIIELGADRSLLIDGDLLGTAPTDSTEAAVAKTNDSADQIINALNEGKDLSTDLEATAAGLSAGAGGGEGSGFVRLMRIAEGVDPLSFNFATALDTFEPPPTANFADAIAAEIIADNKNPEFVDTNNIPLGTDQTTTTPEDTPVSGQLVAKDDNGDVLIFSKTSDPSHGTVVVNANGAYTYIPNKDYTGPDSFQVQVSDDGKGGTDTLTVNVGVTPVNDAPVASNDSASTVINTPILNINVLANDKDIDGDTLTITSAQAQDPSKGTVSINPDGTINFIPANNVLGPVVINYSISDGKGGTDTAQLTINVGDVSTPPIQKIEVGQPGLQDDSVIEGNQLVFNVTLSAASPKAESYSFNLGNGTASTIDYGTASFSNGVTYDASTGKITVPAGVNSFSVTLPTVDDNLVEGSETVLLNIGGQTATGTILDNDSSTLSVTPALDNVSVSEGSAADFTVKLSNPSATDTQVTLNLITTGTNGNASAADVAGLQYKDSNGSWVNVPANGQVTIAAGQTEVIVRVPTVQDGVYEGKENFSPSTPPSTATPCRVKVASLMMAPAPFRQNNRVRQITINLKSPASAAQV
ncbi:retention module-containing protein [Deefgea sp. CFH1-16]|uniref:retention module-containing protein n=1 Tax=Deefgea sp. CFH1-16 TaxID=2675457 RepID=UPI0015F52725|nr:retention module-containing protein [Deefgea sp. CFH1-16]MBM5574503.1 retention module-containing protein [Deefgea sp. CFH1-16]